MCYIMFSKCVFILNFWCFLSEEIKIDIHIKLQRGNPSNLIMWVYYVMHDSTLIYSMSVENHWQTSHSTMYEELRDFTATLPFSYWPAHSFYLLYRLLSSDERTLLCFKNKLIYQIVDWSQRGWEKWICSRKKKLFFHHHHLFFSVPCLLHTFLFSFSLTACQWGIFSVSLASLLNRTLPCKASLVVCHFISGELVCFLMSEWKKRQIWLQTISKSPTHSTWNTGHLSFCSLFKTWDDYHMLNPHGLGGLSSWTDIMSLLFTENPEVCSLCNHS